MKIEKILIVLIAVILTVGAVSASQNTTAPDIAPVKTEKLNASYDVIVDEEYLKGSGFEGSFNIEMYDRQCLNGNLEIYVDDDLKYSQSPAADYDYDSTSWESGEYQNSYCILDIHFLDRLGLAYGPHKAEFRYSGDTLFNDFNETRHFNYTYLHFYVPEAENDFEATCTICVESHDATGKLKIVLDNRTIHDEKFTGYYYTDLENLTLGEHAYDIYYTGNKQFPSIHKHATFMRSYEFDTYPEDGEKLPIDENRMTVYLPCDGESNVTVRVNNRAYSARVIDGEATIDINGFSIGENIIYLTYGDDKYYERTIRKNITVIPALHFTYGESGPKKSDAKATLIMPQNARGTLELTVDGESFTADLINGTATLPLDMVEVGLHSFCISYSGDYEQYLKDEEYNNIFIGEMEIIKITEDITLELPEGESGTLTVKINNQTETVLIENETLFTYPLDLEEGIWDVEVTFIGQNITKTKAARLDMRTKYFDLTCEDIYYKDSVKEAYLEYDYSTFDLKRARAYMDGKSHKISSYGYIDLSKLSLGRHTLLVTYLNDKNEVIYSQTKTFAIAGYSYPKLELKDVASQELNEYFDRYSDYITIADNTTLVMDADFNYNVKGNITVYKTVITYYNDYYGELEDSVIAEYGKFHISNGKARLNIPSNLFNGKFGMKLAITLEDGNEINKSFIIYSFPKVVHPSSMMWQEKQTLTVYLPGEDNVTIGMFGYFKPIYSKIINGKAEFPLSSLPVRNGFPVTFIYKQDLILSMYNLKLNVNDPVKKITAYYDEATAYSLKVPKIYGKDVKKGETVTFKIAGKTVKVKTDKNGVAKLKIPNTIKPGTYTLTATYKYGKISKKVTIKHVLSIKTVKVKKSAKKLVLTATLKGKKVLKNKKVTFKFNGKTYKAKTNSKGVAKVTIKSSVLKKLKVGKKITYQATYLKDTIKKTAKVKK